MTRAVRRRRDHGGVRQLASGRWQATVWMDTENRRVSLGTFETRGGADAAIAAQRTDESRGQWIDPAAGLSAFQAYATSWIESHPKLGRGTRALYRTQLKSHLAPAFGNLPLKDIKPAQVRQWFGTTTASASTRAKAYRLLRAILNGAVEDELLLRNPCTIPGGGAEPRSERPMVSVKEVLAIADAAEPRFRVAFILAAFASLRNAEICGLQRRDIDCHALTVSIRRQRATVGATTLVENPKSDSQRTVAVPAQVCRLLTAHMEEFCADSPEAWVFTKRNGQPLDRHYLNRYWRQACAEVEGLPARLHLHDLRGTGATWAAIEGATLKELMDRLGHSTINAALVYQRTAKDRDRELADRMGALLDH